MPVEQIFANQSQINGCHVKHRHDHFIARFYCQIIIKIKLEWVRVEGGVETNDRIRTTTSSSLVNEWIPKSTNDIYIVSHISLPTNKQKKWRNEIATISNGESQNGLVT